MLKAVCGRDEKNVKGFAEKWGYESTETDWRKMVERKDIDVIDIATPNNSHKEIAIAYLRRQGRQGDFVREAAVRWTPPRDWKWFSRRRQAAVKVLQTWFGTTIGECPPSRWPRN